MNENENITYWNIWDAAKPVLRNFTAVNACCKSNLYIFSFVIHAFRVINKTPFIQGHEYLPLDFLLRVLCF